MACTAFCGCFSMKADASLAHVRHQALLGNLARASRNPTPKFSWVTLRLAVGANDSANGLERGRCAMSTTITSYAVTTTA